MQADLALGRHAEVVAELEALVAQHPLRERLRAQLMLALYRSGRQADALAAYREARATLVDQLGIEPGQALREMEAAVLRQDPALNSTFGLATAGERKRSLLVVGFGADGVDSLLALAEPLASRPLHELVLVQLVSDAGALDDASRVVSERRAALADRQVPIRGVAFTSSEPGADIIRLACGPQVALLLLEGSTGLLAGGRFAPWLARVLNEAPCDVAILAKASTMTNLDDSAPVALPFGGSEHEWAAAEIAAWIAGGEGRSLKLVGAPADPPTGKRDASRLLASVALLVQQVAGVDTEPSFLLPGNGVHAAFTGARVVVVGLPEDWATRGLGQTRTELVRQAEADVLLVRGSLRPGGLAPLESVTRFTWTLSTEL